MARQAGRDGGERNWIGAGLAAAAVAGAAAFLFARRRTNDSGEPVSDVPAYLLNRASGEKVIVGKTVAIKRSREDLYGRWRDFTTFPAFMENVERVEDLGGGRSQWTIKGPLGADVRLVTRITEDEPGRVIAWESEAESDIATTGRVEFEEVDPERGTLVRLLLRYDPPGGTAGRLAAKLLQREPEVQARRDLRRFKQWMETGEVSTNASPSGRAGESPTEARI